ncbi:MAG: alpha/beta hydrolase [Sphingomonadaceae bacterium]
MLAAPVAAQAPAERPEGLTHLIFASWRVAPPPAGSARFVPLKRAVERQALASYGPFRVIGPARAALVGVTDSASPAQFAALLRDHPGIATLELIECPGTEDDRANLKLGRMIRAAGIATHVPAGGSVRSGAVELLLAGTQRRIDDGAEFAVHAWIAEDGREAHQFAAGSAEHAGYIAYYREMGMAEAQARAFYAMTNSVRFDDAKWLGAAEMRGWLGQSTAPSTPTPAPRLAYLDLPALLP